MLKRLGAFACLLAVLLCGCASQAPLPSGAPRLDLPLQLHVQREQAGQQLDWLLVIQQDGDVLRWSLLDPLGRPLARQRLAQARWQAEGLLPPNPEARELFAALLFALTPAADLAQAYAGQDWHAEEGRRSLDQGARRWTVAYRQALRFDLNLKDGLRYRIAPLAPSQDSP
ncbi:MAG: DUF3261 domain-containing protein [Pseudomonadota bacterium]